MFIKQLFLTLDSKQDITPSDNMYEICGWVRTCRTSGSTLGFCNINDGSNHQGLQIVLSSNYMEQESLELFFKSAGIGTYISCKGKMIDSPAKGQKYEMQLHTYKVLGSVEDGYPLTKNRLSLDTLRNFHHLRARTNTFGSIFRIRSSAMKIVQDYFHDRDYLHLDPNIITTNECEGGAGVFQITERDISKPQTLKMIKDTDNYDWNQDHFNCPAYLTVSSQLQLEALACSMGNVFTLNKSFRSEHSSTTKHVSEFTHLEIEIINNSLDDLMDIGEGLIKYLITQLFNQRIEDLQNLNKFISKGLIKQLTYLKDCEYKRIKYIDIVNEINRDIDSTKKKKIQKKFGIDKLSYGDDLGSNHEKYITHKHNGPVFVTHWPLSVKSFYMKQCDDGTCESFDLLMPYGVGELIGGSQREDDYQKLSNMMDNKGIDKESMSFYIDLRKYGSCPHGGFGLGFDRLLMLMTGMNNIKDVIPFPVFYKSCKF